MKRRLCTYALLLTALCMHQSAWAMSLRCGTALIKVGDSKLKVMKHCGEPDYKDVISGALDSRVEEWIYQRSTQEFPIVLTIRGHEVIRIQRLEE